MKSREGDQSAAFAELHEIMARITAEGAMDEEVPIIQGLIKQVEQGIISPIEALERVQKKLQARGDYH